MQLESKKYRNSLKRGQEVVILRWIAIALTPNVQSFSFDTRIICSYFAGRCILVRPLELFRIRIRR
jgi:hypothetical protein